MGQLETDYLIVGAGAMGMAFADEILMRDSSVRVVLLDRRAGPGGHWNDAYPYVTLHQPAAFYGVNSEPLGPGGTYLASGSEVLTYYEKVLRKWEDTGRLQFFPRCEYLGSQRFRSLMNRESEYSVTVKRKTVDATYMKVTVPSTRPPKYEVEPGSNLVAPNELVRFRGSPSDYVVIGGGKTGIDAVLFLLKSGCAPEQIRWVIPHDAWLIDRAAFDPARFVELGSQMQEIAEGDSIEAIMASLESSGKLLRLDPKVRPTKYRCATVSRDEWEQLRRVDQVVRKGRVQQVTRENITLEQGTLQLTQDSLLVDCTADGLAKRPIRPVFEGAEITLQATFVCQQVFSAAWIGYLESRIADDSKKNALSRPVPHPEFVEDYFATLVGTNENLTSGLKRFPLWFVRSRLSALHYFGVRAAFRIAIRERKSQGQALAKAKALIGIEDRP